MAAWIICIFICIIISLLVIAGSYHKVDNFNLLVTTEYYHKRAL